MDRDGLLRTKMSHLHGAQGCHRGFMARGDSHRPLIRFVVGLIV